MFDIKITATVWYGILISGVAFSGILNLYDINTHGIKICFYILRVLMLNHTQVFHSEGGENCSLTEWSGFKL